MSKILGLVKISRYKVIKMEVSAWKLSQSSQGGGETPMVELTKQKKLDMNINPDQELQEDEEMNLNSYGTLNFSQINLNIQGTLSYFWTRIND